MQSSEIEAFMAQQSDLYLHDKDLKLLIINYVCMKISMNRPAVEIDPVSFESQPDQSLKKGLIRITCNRRAI